MVIVIGNRQWLKKEILPALTDWMDTHRHPFFLKVSLNIADAKELMRLMARTGFDIVLSELNRRTREVLSNAKKSPTRTAIFLLRLKRSSNPDFRSREVYCGI